MLLRNILRLQWCVWLFFAWLLIRSVVGAMAQELSDGEDNFADFTGQTTPNCEFGELRATPPPSWINVPIQTGIEQLQGCQMMLIEDQALLGIIRVLAFDWSTAPDDLPPWPQHIMTVESVLIEQMGYTIIEPVWRRATVPVQGDGFGNGQAVGFSLTIQGNDLPQESQMLVFDRGTTKYLVDLLTPAKSVEQGSYYQMNTQAMGTVIQSLDILAAKP